MTFGPQYCSIPKFTPLILYLLCFSDQAEARRQKVKEAKKRKEARFLQNRKELLAAYAREDEKAAAAGKK